MTTSPEPDITSAPPPRPVTPEADVVASLHQMRTRTDITRGARNEELRLPDDLVESLGAMARAPQAVQAQLDMGEPGRRPSPFIGLGSKVNVTHKTTFDIQDRDPEDVRYIRFAKAARVNSDVSNQDLKIGVTVPGYVSFETTQLRGAGQQKGEPDDRFLERVGGLVNEAFENAEWQYAGEEVRQGAQWSFDGPHRQFDGPVADNKLQNTDTPGLASDVGQYPILQRYEFIGVLYDQRAQQILNVQHYGDTLKALNEQTPVTRGIPSAAALRSPGATTGQAQRSTSASSQPPAAAVQTQTQTQQGQSPTR
ncbi:hypothetical protein [Wenjunlia tyrosinilytica]|uniref:Uncharacterized protein n=1 Tax=Wenjunlia tyrosinilytica TaxID=1544741 RepID=A0A917ZEK1_9ACTN|nr:hypothetical protein [Wenjunlia tyrosinilytica]GGO81905.1 hypothetical protein GCM10012280_07280 [Wenjunlia tyrosinilytica]